MTQSLFSNKATRHGSLKNQEIRILQHYIFGVNRF